MLGFSKILPLILVIVAILIGSLIFVQARRVPQNNLKPLTQAAKNADNITAIKTLPTNSSPPLYSASPAGEVALSLWLYPNAEKLDTGGQDLSLKSSDDPQIVTNWYKNQITSKGFSSKSFINTTTNGNTLNQLVGNDGQGEVDISIKRLSDSTSTYITVSVE